MKKSSFIHTQPSAVLFFALFFLIFGCQKDEDIGQLAPQDNLAAAALDKSGSKTAQSVGVNFNGVPSSDIVLDVSTNTTWTYDHDCVESYFVFSSTGCPPPGTENSLLAQIRSNNRCAFWSGGTLTGASASGSRRCTQGGPMLAWTANLTPTVASVTPSCWNSTTTTSGTPTTLLSAQADVAGQSLLIKGNNYNGKCNSWNKKFSFALLDEYGYTRITNVVLTLQSYNGVSWQDVSSSGNPVDLTNIQMGTFGAMYYGNAGVFGNPEAIAQLVSGQSQGDIMSNAINSGDNFCGNDTAEADASYAAVAHGPALSASVGEGTYRFLLTGTVKGNAASMDQSIAVTTNITNISIGAPNCN